MKLFTISGDVIFEADANNIRTLVELTIKERISLQSANLRDANLQYANLQSANLEGANLRGALLSKFQIIPEAGGFYAWKKINTLSGDAVIKIYIPANAKRTSSLVGRKCRASHVKVISDIEGTSRYDPNVVYKRNSIVYANSFDDDIRVECSFGIHFFITKEEAEEY